MSIKESQLLTKNLKICENCEYLLYKPSNTHFIVPLCTLSKEHVGLFGNCEKFKRNIKNCL